MSKTISFYTLGCRLNQSETAGIGNSFRQAGFDIVDIKDKADIAVINTCTVTENGDADTRRIVHKINRINPDTQIALIGCQAQVQKEKLAELPNVCWVVGNERKMDLVSVFKEHPNPETTEIVTPTVAKKSFTQDIASIDHTHTRANLKIQDGCDFFCTFCEIPYARGRARSREFDNIMVEAQALVAAGHKEIVLTGINVGTYDYDNKTILHVIQALNELEGLERIRISSIEPTTIPYEIFDWMKDPTHKLCRYLHIPIQSGSNAILKAMERKYTVEEFLDFIGQAYASVPEICIGTDVIVGFPGETQALFQETEAVLREAPIHYFHVFSYSARYMAKSRKFEDIVDPEVIQQRSQHLRELSNRKRRIFYENLLNTQQKVLFEQKKSDFFGGWTDNYVKLKVSTQEDLHNQYKKVRLTRIEDNSIIGELS